MWKQNVGPTIFDEAFRIGVKIFKQNLPENYSKSTKIAVLARKLRTSSVRPPCLCDVTKAVDAFNNPDGKPGVVSLRLK